MQTVLSVIIGIVVFLVALKILGKLIKAICFGVLCTAIYWCITHPEAVSAFIALIQTKIGGFI